MNQASNETSTELYYFLEEASKANPQVSGLLLKRKMTRIMRTLESLTSKKKSLDLEIQRQRRALTLKRNELKRTRSSSRKSSSAKGLGTSKLESFQYRGLLDLRDYDDQQKLDSKLLDRSAKLLECFD